ncbi:hypothetical protein SAMN06272738_3347 [Bacillus sp. JKS001846]|nr:hypothetical protein SAMN06272738_3347 [Bacillus sp. JKS001846]
MSSVLYWTHGTTFVEGGRIIVNIEYINELKCLRGEHGGNKTRRN